MTRTRKALLLAGSRPEFVLDALAVCHRHDGTPFDEIHVLTPRGRRAALGTALFDRSPGRSPLDRLFRRLRVPRHEVHFNRGTTHEVDADGPDGPDDVLEVLRSIHQTAGARVTGAFGRSEAAVAVALSLSMQAGGRTGDRLFHIIEPPRIPDDPSVVRSAPRCVQIPLITLGHHLPSDGRMSYRQIAERCVWEGRQVDAPAAVEIDLRRRTLKIDGVSHRLPAMLLVWYAHLASIAPLRFPLVEISEKLSAGAPIESIPELMALTALRARVYPRSRDDWPATLRRACGTMPGLPSTVSKINRSLRAGFGAGAVPYLVEGGRGNGGYRLRLAPESIRIIE